MQKNCKSFNFFCNFLVLDQIFLESVFGKFLSEFFLEFDVCVELDKQNFETKFAFFGKKNFKFNSLLILDYVLQKYRSKFSYFY